MENKREILWNKPIKGDKKIEDLEVKPKLTDKVTTFICNSLLKLLESLACYAVWAVLIHWIVTWIATR